jgi:hypothetical protein
MKKTMKELEAEYLKTNTVIKCEEFKPYWLQDDNSRKSKAYSDDRYELKPIFDKSMIEIAPNYICEFRVRTKAIGNNHTFKYIYINQENRKCVVFQKTVIERLNKGIWKLK